MPKLHRSLETRFWEKVEKAGSNECWLWTASTAKGYGCIGDGNGRIVGAHRVSWAIVNGDIPPGKMICHFCDNPRCVNPRHLFLGSSQDNMSDMSQKLRGKSGRSKLTDDDVRAAIRMRAEGMTNTQIANCFGVKQPAISKALNGYTPRYRSIVSKTACAGCMSA